MSKYKKAAPLFLFSEGQIQMHQHQSIYFHFMLSFVETTKHASKYTDTLCFTFADTTNPGNAILNLTIS